MVNALLACGYEAHEDEIIGYGAAPAFTFQEGSFPFIGGRSLDMRERYFELTGIPWGMRVPQGGEDIWAGPLELLGRGVPVMLRVDMRYLPYLYGGKIGPAYMSFGWHVITLFKVDGDRAWVSDTGHGGLMEIRLRDLDRARRSKTKAWPPRAEYSWAEPSPGYRRPGRDELVAMALGLRVDPGSVTGSWAAALGRFPEDLARLIEYVPTYLLGPALSYMSDSIERNGTGGAAFRTLYLLWLRRERERTADAALQAALDEVIPAAAESEKAWHGLAARFSAAAEAVSSKAGPAGMKDARTAVAADCARAAEAVVSAERAWARRTAEALEGL